ncbi:hypothetical protein DBV15_06005 [Temnothorax longispinosus]|uniref:Uncharacterized protein n=1 Tax=Temnothorax longispinosus TaxID=300112 RepID=A0A4S2KME9_9HYME|nr:hypothetical protein DBV15_06005 [Temnothorax longispinosus]
MKWDAFRPTKLGPYKARRQGVASKRPDEAGRRKFRTYPERHSCHACVCARVYMRRQSRWGCGTEVRDGYHDTPYSGAGRGGAPRRTVLISLTLRGYFYGRETPV